MAEVTYIKVFVDYLDAIEPLGDAERGRLFTSLLSYARTGEAPQLGGNERFLFPMMRAQIDRDVAAMTELSETRSKARSKSKQMISSVTSVTSVTNDIKCGKDKDKDKDKDNDDKGDNAREARFVPPSVDDVRAYCLERKNSVDPESFVDFYESKGWIVGKTRMKDWKAAVRNWERSERPEKRNADGKKSGYNVQHHGDDLSDLQRQAIQRMMDGGV